MSILIIPRRRIINPFCEKTFLVDFAKSLTPARAWGNNTATFSRNSVGYQEQYVGGVIGLTLKTANNYRNDIWCDANGLTLQGYKGEIEGTNTITQSQTITSWDKQVAGDGTNTSSVLSPNGSDYMSGLIANNTSSTHWRRRQSVAVAAGSQYIISGFAKAGNKPLCYFECYSASGIAASRTFNLSTGAWHNAGSGAQYVSGDFRNCGNGIYKFWIVFNSNTATSYNFYVQSDTAVFTGDGATVNTYIWGFQNSLGSYPSSYIPTTTGAVTRLVDSLSYAADNNLGGQSTKQNCVIGKFIMRSKPTANRSIFEISDGGSSADRIYLYFDSNGYLNLASAATGGNAGACQIATNFCANKRYTYAACWKQNHMVLHVRDDYANTITTSTVDTTVDIPDELDQMAIGPIQYGVLGKMKILKRFKGSRNLLFRNT